MEEKKYLNIGNEKIEIRDVDISFPKIKKEEPQQIPQRREVYTETKNNPQPIKQDCLIPIKKATLYVLIGLMAILIIMIPVGMVWMNHSFNKLAEKEFSPVINDGSDTIMNNFTNNINSNPTISNQHTIINQMNYSLSESQLISAVEKGINNQMTNLVRNVTNATH